MDLTQLEVRLLGVNKKYDFELPDELAAAAEREEHLRSRKEELAEVS
jgi:hypothetical protein